MDNHFINNKPDPKYKRLMSLIPHGEENARSMHELARLCSVSCREFRKMVEVARCDGQIIASSDAGYYIPSSEYELKEYYRRTMYRVDTTLATLRPVKDIIDEIMGNLEEGVIVNEDE